MTRMGIGYDAHLLVPGRPLVLSGVTVPYVYGLEGHSDGDVVAHANIDALLGAAALGDMGTHFRADDPLYPAGVSSMLLMERAVAMVRERGWQVENVDATIVAQRPPMAPYIEAMRQSVAKALGASVDRVSIKATTTDGLGFTGTGHGMAAHAVASLVELP